jgi:fructosamine-3-kinase
MLNQSFINHIENLCSGIENKPVKLRAYERMYGGDINETFRLAMSEKDYFIKINEASYVDMFQKEADGLQLLADSRSFVIPKVYHNGVFEKSAFLLLEFIPALLQGDNPKDFAENLAKMHQTTNDTYGLSYDNYIGRLSQKNTFNTDWIDFFIQNRLQFQIDLAGNKMPVKIQSQFEKLYQKLPDLSPVDKPSLLHGDLWSGNYFYNIQGKAVVFDPAVYYGHREVDLAMMSLFGGFSREIYDIYNTLFPLETGWQDRLKIYQLYPLLVHFNLFGNSYLSGIQQVLDFYVKNK